MPAKHTMSAEEITALRAENATLRELVRDLVDPDPCVHDHHGYCQTHWWTTERSCPHGRARELGLVDDIEEDF